MKNQFNLNTLLLAIVMGLATWTLKEVNEQGKDFSALKVSLANMKAEQELQRINIATNTNEIVLLKIRLAGIRGSN